MSFKNKIFQILDLRLFFSTLALIFVSEMGDKTQVATMLLASAKPAYVFWVALGSASALICSSFIEVIIGSEIIARFVKISTIRLASGVVFLVLGILLVTGLMGSGQLH